jgi:hypothetical protein
MIENEGSLIVEKKRKEKEKEKRFHKAGSSKK